MVWSVLPATSGLDAFDGLPDPVSVATSIYANGCTGSWCVIMFGLIRDQKLGEAWFGGQAWSGRGLRSGCAAALRLLLPCVQPAQHVKLMSVLSDHPVCSGSTGLMRAAAFWGKAALNL